MKIKTLTIGIPVFNEAANIVALIKSIQNQKLKTIKISKIIVYSDASTDNTIEILQSMKIKSLKILSGKTRMGKSYGMNQIIKHTTSDMLVIVDGDILIRDRHMLEKLIDPVINQGADLTSARVKEFWTKTTFENILKISMLLKKDIFESFRQGNNIYTCHGRARAFSKRFYQAIYFKKEIVAEDAFTYLYAVTNGFVYKFATMANVHYRLPGTFKDHQKQSVRFIQSYQQLAREFGTELILKETKISKIHSLPFVIKYFLRYPITLSLYITMLIYIKIRSIFIKEVIASWDLAVSTKKVFAN